MKSVIVLPLAISLLATRAYAQCDACLYTADDATDCKDYGQLGGELVAWPRASQECLDVYQIKVAQQNVASICTYASAFVNAFRVGDMQSSDAALGLGASEGFFFEQDPSNNNIPKLKDSITVSGTAYDCSDDPTDCWNALKAYFEVGAPGHAEMEQVCETLENKNRVNLQLEQSTVRIRLCEELQNDVTTTECAELEAMIQELGAANPDLACSAYGFGIGDATIPGCEDVILATQAPTEDGTLEASSEETGDPTNGEDGESSSATAIGTFTICALVVSWVSAVTIWF
ncbi:hypothetical protein FisN_18Hh066 [Fistulifera solaris]|uniref:Secreted protein n=1 Tax=Fistulifera solaris TaxID=1519565 RepID=A0A1Z5JVK6_FISSO|nr:hypothetical protein FisN_18Hh066 [Fistulifera solaris]|eukprot:GAX17862.1 hypothetical protein FisN_18Hh066 [Fistulifera solaris]